MDSHHSCHHQHKSKDSPASGQQFNIYSCPMHPEIQQNSPGNCPKCGMALEATSDLSTQTQYVCPMHPEIISKEPGDCPKCGMALEARTIEADAENTELNKMNRRFWLSLILAVPVFIISMLNDLSPDLLPEAISLQHIQWIEFVNSRVRSFHAIPPF